MNKKLDEHEEAIGGNDSPMPISAWLTMVLIIAALVIGGILLTVVFGGSHANWKKYHIESCIGKC